MSISPSFTRYLTSIKITVIIAEAMAIHIAISNMVSRSISRIFIVLAENAFMSNNTVANVDVRTLRLYFVSSCFEISYLSPKLLHIIY